MEPGFTDQLRNRNIFEVRVKIILRRTGALGDVILTTAVVRRMRREYPAAHIAVETAYPDVFRHNPHLGGPEPDSGADERLISLDLAYEKRPTLHIVAAYMEEAFGDTGSVSDWRPELFPRYGSIRLPSNAIAVHAAVAGWQNKTLPRSFWKDVLQGICDAGFWPVLVGTERDRVFGFSCTEFFSPDILAQAAVIRSCKAFIGSDSSLVHVATAMKVPMVAIFTSVNPRTIVFDYDLCRTVLPEGLSCIGCHNRRTPPVTTEACERGDLACLNAVKPVSVLDALLSLVQP